VEDRSVAVGGNQIVSVITQAVRPSRALTLVPRDLPAWETLLLLLAEFATDLWAGRWSLVAVPADANGESPELFQRLAMLFDPDFIGTFEPGVAVLHEVGEGGEMISDLERQLIAMDGNADALPELIRDMPAHWFDAPLAADWLRNLNPMPPRGIRSEFRVSGTNEPGWPVTTWRPYRASGRIHNGTTYADPVVLTDSPDLSLMSAWTLGRLSPNASSWIDANGGTRIRLPLFDRESYEAAGLVTGGGRSLSSHFSGLEARLGTSVEQAAPFARSALDAAPYAFRLDGDVFVKDAVLVAGDDLSDFLLWLLLSRLRDGVFWLPSRLLGLSRDARRGTVERGVASSIIAAYRSWARSTHVEDEWKLVSYSLDRRALGHFKRRIRAAERVITPPSLADRLKTITDIDSIVQLVSPRLRTFERDPFTGHLVVPVKESGQTFAPLSMPVPASSVEGSLGEKRWITDIRVDDRILPMSPDVAAGFVEDGRAARFARVTEFGTLSLWHPHYLVTPNSTIRETWVTGVRVPPKGVALLRKVLGPDLEVRVHDKGRYVDVIRDRIGLDGLNRLIGDLGFHWIASRFATEDPWKVGKVPLVKLDDIRDAAPDALDSLLASELAFLVHVAKCAVCGDAQIVAIWDIERTRACPRCQAAIRTADLATDELFATQRVALNQVMQLFIENRSDAAITAFLQLAASSRRAELITEVEIRGDGMPTLQADIVAIIDGAVTIGEAKTGQKYLGKSDARDYGVALRHISEKARPAPVIGVHAWTRDFDSGQRASLKADPVPISFLRLPHRDWYT
jgi:hypothetical protein